MNFFQAYIHPQQKERLLFLGYWIGSLIIWSFAMNVSLVIVIVFSVIGNYVVVRPLAKLFFLLKKFVNKKFFNNFCLLYTSPSPRDRTRSRMPSSA